MALLSLVSLSLKVEHFQAVLMAEENALLVISLQEKIKSLSHYLLDSKKTHSFLIIKPNAEYTLDVIFFNSKGETLLEEIVDGDGNKHKGAVLTLYPREKSIHHDLFYLKEKYQKSRLYTRFAELLINSARESGFEKISLMVDELSPCRDKLISYWQNRHGFTVPDPQFPRYLEKILKMDASGISAVAFEPETLTLRTLRSTAELRAHEPSGEERIY